MGKSELGFQAQVRKVVEITKCSSEDAAYVLGENDNDVDRAVMAIVDQPDANVWKENKKKSKKEDKKQALSNAGPRRLGPRPPRPGSNVNDNRRSVPGKASGKGGQTDSTTQQNTYGKQPTDGEFSLKNGPLIFESSAISGQQQSGKPSTMTAANNDFPPVGGTSFNSSVYDSAAIANATAASGSDSKKLSFAAVAAKSRAPPPPPVVQPPQPVASPVTTASSTFARSHASDSIKPAAVNEDGPTTVTMSTSLDVNESLVDKFADAKLDDRHLSTTTNSAVDSQPIDDGTKSIASSTFSANVNREFTDQLKNDIGIGLASSHRSVGGLSTTASETIPPPVCLGDSSVFAASQSSVQAAPILDLISDQPTHLAAHASSSDVGGVEFLDDVSSPRATGYEFGFNKFVVSHNSMIGRLQQQSSLTHQVATDSPKSDSAVSQSNAGLSYTYPNSFNYQSANVRQTSGGGIADALFGGKVNGTTGHQLTQETLPSQQVAPSLQQQPSSVVGQQHQPPTAVASSLQHQPVAQPPQQPAVAQPSTQQTQHSLQQQQQQMYTATAQFPGYALPYLYSPVAGMRDKNGMVFDSSVVGGAQSHQQPSHNKPAAGIDYGAGASVTTAGNAFNASVYDNNSTTAGDPKKLSFAAVAPPPGFSTPHFMQQQGLQSLFHAPSQSMFPIPGGYAPPMPFPLLFSGGGPQQQQSQQRQPPIQQGHYGQQQQHLLQNHHQSQQQRHAAAGALGGMDHVSFMDIAKYPNGGSNNNLPGLGSAPYAAFGMGGNSGANQGQQLHRNQSLNQDNEGTGAW